MGYEILLLFGSGRGWVGSWFDLCGNGNESCGFEFWGWDGWTGWGKYYGVKIG